MKNRHNCSRNTVILMIGLAISYLVCTLAYPHISKLLAKAVTPDIQQEFYSDVTLHYDEGEVARNTAGAEVYINLWSKILYLTSILIVCDKVAKKYIRKVYEKDENFGGIGKVVKAIEIILILAGLYVFVFQTNSIGARYGIYKSQLNADSQLAYYPVVELPNIWDYLIEENMNRFDKLKMMIILNSDNIARLCEVAIAMSGGVMLPLRYCVGEEDKRLHQVEQEKERNDMISCVTEKVKRDMKKLRNKTI